MLYAIMTQDAENTLALRMKCRTEHLARLSRLKAEGRLVLAGPFPAIASEDPGEAGFTGSLIVAEFESLEMAKLWVSEDPYVTAGVVASAVVKPFKQVLP